MGVNVPLYTNLFLFKFYFKNIAWILKNPLFHQCATRIAQLEIAENNNKNVLCMIRGACLVVEMDWWDQLIYYKKISTQEFSLDAFFDY